MWRKLYYLLPPHFRFFLRWIFYLPTDLFSRRDPDLIPPRRLIYTGRGDFKKQGLEWLSFFKNKARLQPTDAVLDIGSGIGRIAVPLTTYLTYRYEGFDVVKLGVNWCEKYISAKFPIFHFQYIDLFNDLYKAKGLDAKSMEFPYEDKSFDFVCSISVFTHLLPGELENYLVQMSRVMKPGAKAVCTFFILDEKSKNDMQHSNSRFNFRYKQSESYSLMDLKVKSANVAYEENYLIEQFLQNGFEIVDKVNGHWSGRPLEMELAFQDIFVLQKK